MKILIAEYAVARNIKHLIPEGRAILSTLAGSFRRAGHDVIYPERVRSFGEWIKKNADRTDAGLVVAPDRLLADFVEILEEKTTNLGCSPECIRLCADKLRTTEILEKNGVPVPRILSEGGTGKYVIKPRFGCGSEGVEIIKKFRKKRGFITCKFIDGKHISASIIVGKTTLPLTINKQRIKFDKGKISYDGGVVPYEVPNKKEIFDAFSKYFSNPRLSPSSSTSILPRSSRNAASSSESSVLSSTSRPYPSSFPSRRTFESDRVACIVPDNLDWEVTILIFM